LPLLTPQYDFHRIEEIPTGFFSQHGVPAPPKRSTISAQFGSRILYRKARFDGRNRMFEGNVDLWRFSECITKGREVASELKLLPKLISGRSRCVVCRAFL